MEIPTAKIPADNARGFKIVNADDPRVTQQTEDKPKRGRKPKEAEDE
jgi:hypothetical protein